MITRGIDRRWTARGLLLYWVAFCGLAFWKGTVSGEQYPWTGVLAVCAVLGLETGILHLAIAPRAGERKQGRMGFLALFVASLLILASTIAKDDRPPYFYVSAVYAFVTLAGLVLWACVLGVKILLERL